MFDDDDERQDFPDEIEAGVVLYESGNIKAAQRLWRSLRDRPDDVGTLANSCLTMTGEMERPSLNLRGLLRAAGTGASMGWDQLLDASSLGADDSLLGALSGHDIDPSAARPEDILRFHEEEEDEHELPPGLNRLLSKKGVSAPPKTKPFASLDDAEPSADDEDHKKADDKTGIPLFDDAEPSADDEDDLFSDFSFDDSKQSNPLDDLFADDEVEDHTVGDRDERNRTPPFKHRSTQSGIDDFFDGDGAAKAAQLMSGAKDKAVVERRVSMSGVRNTASGFLAGEFFDDDDDSSLRSNSPRLPTLTDDDDFFSTGRLSEKPRSVSDLKFVEMEDEPSDSSDPVWLEIDEKPQLTPEAISHFPYADELPNTGSELDELQQIFDEATVMVEKDSELARALVDTSRRAPQPLNLSPQPQPSPQPRRPRPSPRSLQRPTTPFGAPSLTPPKSRRPAEDTKLPIATPTPPIVVAPLRESTPVNTPAILKTEISEHFARKKTNQFTGSTGVGECEALFARGDILGAYVSALDLSETENSQELKSFTERASATLLGHAVEHIKPLDRIASLNIPANQIFALKNIDHRGGFLLSQVDGSVDIEFLIDLGAMPREEAALLLLTLSRRGIISF